MLVKYAIATCSLAVVASASSLLHLRKVQVEGDTGSVSRGQVSESLAAAGRMTSWGIDLEAFAAEVQGLPQVRSARARLGFPGTVVLLSVQARRPVARTRAGALIDDNGEVYHSAAGAGGSIPIYDGPLSEAAAAAELCRALRSASAASGFAVSQLSWRADGWQVLLGNGWRLRLGRIEHERRIRRFASAWPQLVVRFGGFSELGFDLRYMRGMAVSGLPAGGDSKALENEHG